MPKSETLQALRVRRMVAELSARRHRTRRKPPKPRFPHGVETRYTAAVIGIQRLLERAVRDIIYPSLANLVVEASLDRPDSALVPTLDQATETITKLIEGVEFRLGRTIDIEELDSLTGRVGEEIADFNAVESERMLQSTLGISATTAEPWAASTLKAFRKENVNLIKSLVGDELTQIENILIRGQRRGLRVEVLREQIQKRFKVSKSKANLLARDQTNKLNGEFTALRQTSIGVEEYIWRNSGDERVRGNPDGLYPNAIPSHWDREGKKYKWSDPPEGGHPGEDYQCRCYAEAVLEPLLEAEESVTAAPLRFERIAS